MQKQNVVVGLLVFCLIASLGVISFQQARIHEIESGAVIPFNGGSDWGATITLRVYRSGFLLSEESHHNVITNAARSALRPHIANVTTNVWKYIAIGTSTGGDATSTTLVSEYDRQVAEYATVGSYNFTLIYTWDGVFTGQTITEVGVFNAAAAGVMLNYDDSFSRGPLSGDDTLQVTVNFQIGS